MATAIEQLLSSEVLSEEVRTTLSEAWETKLAEAREEITADLREEFANRYDADKEQMVEALDAMLTDTITKELKEFSEDKRDAVAAKIDYQSKIVEHAKLLDQFVMETLKKEIQKLESELSSNEMSSLINFNRNAQTFKANMNSFIDLLLDNNENIYGFGASTKGNMLLQFLERDRSSIRGVFDNSPKKIGTTMLGSDIEVLDEKTMEKHEVDSLISLPYYYHENFKTLVSKLYKNQNAYKLKLIKPLPEIKYTNI